MLIDRECTFAFSAAKAYPVRSNKHSARKKKKSKRGPQGKATSVKSRVPGVWLVDLALLLSVVIILVAAPFYRGLLFQEDLLVLHLISFSLFIIWCSTRLLRPESVFLKTPLDICVLLFLFFYLLSLVSAVHPRAAVAEFLKVANYAAIYYLVTDLCRRCDFIIFPSGLESKLYLYLNKIAQAFRPHIEDEKERPSAPLVIILYALYISGIAIAAGSLLNVAGILDIPYAFFDGRITTSIGYANTGAVYLMSTYFIGLGLALSLKQWYLRPFLFCPAALLMFNFVFTYSRGAWLMFPLLALIFVLLCVPGQRLRAFFYISITAISLMPFIIPLNNALEQGAKGHLFILLFLSTLLMAGFGYISERLVQLSTKAKLYLSGFTITLFAICILFIFTAGLVDQSNYAMPEDIIEGVFSRSTSVDLRIAHFKDAFRIIADYPLLGVGGGGWNALYRGYQEQPYHTRTVHNHYLEVWVETGFFGFLSFIGIWVSLIYAFFSNRIKRSIQYRQFGVALFVPAAAIGLHSTIDWNLSFGAVSIYLFALLALSNSLDHKIYHFELEKLSGVLTFFRKHNTKIVITVAILLLLYSAALLKGLNATRRSQELIADNLFKQAEKEIELAIRYDPLRADSYHNLALLIERQLRTPAAHFSWPDLLLATRKAYELEPYNPLYRQRYAIMLINTGQIDQGLEHLRAVIEIRPFGLSYYSDYADLLMTVALSKKAESGSEEFASYLHEIISLEKLMLSRFDSAEALYYYIGQAHILLGDNSAGRSYLKQITENDPFYNEAVVLLNELE